MTEEQAARMACPATDLAENCRGSQCMMWRWHLEIDEDATKKAWDEHNANENIKSKESMGRWLFYTPPYIPEPPPGPMFKSSETQGYCGLGGKQMTTHSEALAACDLDLQIAIATATSSAEKDELITIWLRLRRLRNPPNVIDVNFKVANHYEPTTVREIIQWPTV